MIDIPWFSKVVEIQKALDEVVLKFPELADEIHAIKLNVWTLGNMAQSAVDELLHTQYDMTEEEKNQLWALFTVLEANRKGETPDPTAIKVLCGPAEKVRKKLVTQTQSAKDEVATPLKLVKPTK